MRRAASTIDYSPSRAHSATTTKRAFEDHAGTDSGEHTGTVAVLLSAIGLAGLAGYTVGERTPVRFADGVGRASGDVRAIVSPMFRPIAVGFACGVAGGTAAAKILAVGWRESARPGSVTQFLAAWCCSELWPPWQYGASTKALKISPAKALQHE